MTFTWFLSQHKPVETWKPNCQQLSLLDFLVGVRAVCSGGGVGWCRVQAARKAGRAEQQATPDTTTNIGHHG